MGLDKAIGILCIVAVILAVFFLIIRRSILEDVDASPIRKNLAFFIIYLMFLAVFWGLGMLFVYGVLLLIG